MTIEDVAECFICREPMGKCGHLETALRSEMTPNRFRTGGRAHRHKAYSFGNDPAIEHDELVEQIEMGWGETPGHMIPANWREVPGPAKDWFRKW